MSEWEKIFFYFVPYKQTGLSILAAFEDVELLLDEHIVKTMTMKGSPFIAPFEEQVIAWNETLVGESRTMSIYDKKHVLRNLKCNALDIQQQLPYTTDK